MTAIDFYLDFLSPYAYLGRHRLSQIATQYGCTISYLPVDLKRVKLAAGNTAPPTVKMPAKLAFALRDFERWGVRYGIAPPQAPACQESRDINVGLIFASERRLADDYARAAFDLIWGTRRAGKKALESDILAAIGDELGLPLDELKTYLASPAAADAYERTHAGAIARGVFGVPTFIVDQEFWWGNDRLFMLEDHLRSHSSQSNGRAVP